MDTQQFLRHILPHGGPHYIVYTDRGENGQNHVVSSIHEMCERMAWLEQAGQQVWHACASYASAGIHTGKMQQGERGEYEKVKKRVQENVDRVKAFWIDLDCGEDKAATGKGYLTQREAVAALYEFCAKVNLPRPLLVNSGYGVHAYWVLTDAVSGHMWTRGAKMLEAVLAFHGVLYDTACTSDCSRVLRPVGSYNRKREEPKLVCIGGAGVPEPIDTRWWFNTIIALGKSVPMSESSRASVASEVPEHLRRAAGNADLTDNTIPDLPVDADKVADNCAQLNRIASNPESVLEPEWRAMLGIVKFCQRPETFAVAWSEGHPDFNEQATLEKMENWGAKPTTCMEFERHNKEGCKGCKHKGTIKSPIALGIVLPEAKADETQAKAKEKFKLPDLPEQVTKAGFTFVKEGILRVTDVAGKPKPVLVTPVHLTPAGWDSGTMNEASTQWVLTNPHSKEVRHINIPMGVSNAGAATLAKILGDAGLSMGNGGQAAMQAYIHAWMQKIMSMRNDPAVSQYGWQANGDFVIGERRYTPDGDVRRARLMGDAANHELLPAFELRGTLDAWVNMVDGVYNLPGQQQYQFMFGTGFGCPLMHLMDSPVRGVTISGWSALGGRGKSTAAYMAMSIYGDPQRQEMNRGQATPNAMMHRLGVMNSLPVLIDEMTNIHPRALSDMLYSISSGQAKQRLKQDGSKSNVGMPWNTMALMTGNRSVINNVSAEKTLASGEMCRVFEYEVGKVSPLSEADARRLFVYTTNHGYAGDLFIKYVITHQDEVRQRLRVMQDHVNTRFRITDIDRFISVAITTTLVGLEIAKELGLVRFDLEALKDWIGNARGVLKAAVEEVSLDGVSAFGMMLQSMQNNLIVTNIEGDVRRGTIARVDRAPRGDVVGRNIVNEQKLYLTHTAIHQWCADNQTDIGEMRRVLKESGMLIGVMRYSLGRGLQGFESPPVTCWLIDTALMSGEERMQTEVKPLRAVQ